MADFKLNIIVVPTYNLETLAIVDASVYAEDPPVVSGATIEIDIPSFNKVTLPFIVGETNIFTSSNLGISAIGVNEPLPDGIYKVRFSISPNEFNYVEKSFVRIDKLQEKYDEAFLQLEMMECNKAIKIQAKTELNSIYIFIQGAIAAANNCAEIVSLKLYQQANLMLGNFINNNCGCSGNNFYTNFN